MIRLIEEHKVPNRRLGRHVHHDPKSRDFEVTVDPSQPLRTTLWSRKAGPWDQGNTGKCTVMAAKGCAMTTPIRHLLSVTLVNRMRSTDAMYHRETVMDDADIPGEWPPDDTGSSVLWSMKLLVALGIISRYDWSFDYQTGLHSIVQVGPGSSGINWYDSFDQPDSDGIIHISPNAGVRGGHAIERRGIVVERQLSVYEQSWGPSWPLKPFSNKPGLFAIPWKDEERLMSEQGEYCVPQR